MYCYAIDLWHIVLLFLFCFFLQYLINSVTEEEEKKKKKKKKKTLR